MPYGKTITIYLEDGTPDGMVTASLSNWSGICVKAPREDIAHSDYEELDAPGIYFLICTDTEDEQDAVYIGEAENLRKRLVQHILDYKSGKEKYYWQKAVMFTGSELNKTLIRYLEHNLTQRARAAKRYAVLTKNTYSETVVKRHEKAAMDEFIDDIQILLSALNYRILDPLASVGEKSTVTDTGEEVFRFEYGEYYGRGYVAADGMFVLMAGAKINPDLKASCKDHTRRERTAYADRIKDGYTTEDIVFKGSSGAAGFVSGASISGPQSWKNSDGKRLKDILVEK